MKHALVILGPQQRWRNLALALLLSAFILHPSALLAQTKTTVADTFTPDTSGFFTVSSPTTWTSSDLFVVPAGWNTKVTVTAGAFSVALIPNVGGAPSGTYYVVQYFLNGNRSSEIWVVPTATPQKLSGVRTAPVPALGTQWPIVQITPPSPCAAPSNYLTWNVNAWLCASSGGVTQLTTRGDLLTLNAALALSRLALGTNGQCLTSNGSDPVWGTCSTGSVTSVALTVPGEFSVSGSPITTSGTFAITKANESANQGFFGPASGGAAAPTFRALVGADLPVPSATTLGGVQSLGVVASKWINSISTSGVPSATQPAFTDISGILSSAQLPIPSALTMGGVRSLAAVASQWINTISTLGIPSATQPAFTDISGTVGAAQLPAASLIPRSVTGTTDTILAADNDRTVEYQGTAANAASLPTPTSLGNTGFFTLLRNATAGPGGTVTVTPTTWTINGAASLAILVGQSCSLRVDSNVATNWIAACGEPAIIAGAGMTATRGPFGLTLASSGGSNALTALAKTASYTLVAGDMTTPSAITFTCTVNCVATLPGTAPATGAYTVLQNAGAFNVTIFPNGKTLNGSAAPKLIYPGAFAIVQSDGTNYKVGDGARATPRPGDRSWAYWKNNCVGPESASAGVGFYVSVLGGAGTVITATATDPCYDDWATTAVSTNVNGYNNASGASWAMGNNILFQQRVQIPTITTVRFWSTLATAGAVTSIAASDGLVGTYAGFRFSTSAADTNWMACVANGVAPTCTSTGVAVVAGNGATLAWQAFDNLVTPAIAFSVNGTVTNVVTAGLPASGSLFENDTTVTTLAAAIRDLRVAWTYVESDK